MAGLNYNCNTPLPEQYEMLMPNGLSPIEQFEWRKHKLGELRMTGQLVVDSSGNILFTDQDLHTKQNAEVIESVRCDENSNTETKIGSEIGSKQEIGQSERRRLTSVQKSSDVGYEDIRTIPRSVVQAVRRQFPETASKSDLFSAVAYIFTNGDCEISERAMEMVKSYRASNNTMATIVDRLSCLERENKRQLELLQSIELCTCFNTFDRRYGSSEPRRGPKLTEFREQDNLDMLTRLREQAKDQMRIDDLAIGRQIYNQIKDKNDE